MARLKEAAEMAKIELSTSTTTHISLPYLTAVAGESKHLEMDLTRTELERQVYDVVQRCRAPIEQALHDANITSKDIDRIIFVGGPTRMPVVRKYYEDLFGRKAEMGVDPMECVAGGAAIQAGVLSGEVGDIVLVDVTPLTLGVETLGGVATSLISRNSPIPVKHTETFTTAADMQTAVTIHVYQGERPMARDNTSLGEFNLEGLAPAPRGIPKVDVTFDIDANGILSVTAKDQATGKTQSISITGSTRLTDEDKQRLIDEAEKYADEDKKRREQADKLNTADSMCYQAERLLADFSDNLTDEMRNRLEYALSETREAISQHDAELATQRADDLEKVIKEAGTVIYSQTTEAPKSGPYSHTEAPDMSGAGGEAKPSGSGPRGKVVDADFTESN